MKLMGQILMFVHIALVSGSFLVDRMRVMCARGSCLVVEGSTGGFIVDRS